MNSKIKPWPALRPLLERLRRARKKVVFTNGCFDVLHFGHVDYLRKARRRGDFLVVGLNTDRSVGRIKGRGRPVNRQRDRAEILSELACVDAVIPFGAPTPLHLIRKIRPHVLVKGADWKLSQIVGREVVESYGGQVVRVRLTPGRSTSGLLGKIRSL